MLEFPIGSLVRVVRMAGGFKLDVRIGDVGYIHASHDSHLDVGIVNMVTIPRIGSLAPMFDYELELIMSDDAVDPIDPTLVPDPEGLEDENRDKEAFTREATQGVEEGEKVDFQLSFKW